MKEVINIGQPVKSHEWFIEKVKEYHGEKVEILSNYKGANYPVNILYHCDKHGDTYTTINAKNICKTYFLPCRQCQAINKSKSAKTKRIGDNSYYYQRLTDYCKKRGGYVLEKKWTGAKNRYHFKCGDPEHPVFSTTADALYSGSHWCPYCANRLGFFQDELTKICNSKNGQLLSEYKDSGTYVSVKCNKHNFIWDMLPSNIKKGRWCPICSMGFNEKVVWDYLNNMQCLVKVQYSFDDLVGNNGEKLKFDFAILNTKNELLYLIEVDDEEHRDNHTGNSRRQIQRQCAIKRDLIKNKYCKENNIPLYRMQVPFRNNNKWSYEDYYKYINTKLKFIVLMSQGEGARKYA